MGIPHTSLDLQTLGADAQRALSSPAGKMMAARGMAPIAEPRDLVSLMYLLSNDGDEKIRNAADSRLLALPPELLRAGFADDEIDQRVIDFFARRVAALDGCLEVMVLNSAIADETVASIATFAPESVVDVIATNEQRLLRHPEIIYAMYMNEHSAMSTVDRAVELAVRNKAKVPGLQAWDEICQAILEAPPAKAPAPERKKNDAAFKHALKHGTKLARATAPPVVPEAEAEASEENTGEKERAKPWRELSLPEKIRMATLGNDLARQQAINDPKITVAMAALKSPMVSEPEILKWAGNHTLDKKLIQYIATKKDWIKSYQLKLVLINNPKTPTGDALRFLQTLRDKDLRSVARSRGVPGPVSQAAKKLTVRINPGSW